jgi:hypothetical protein
MLLLTRQLLLAVWAWTADLNRHFTPVPNVVRNGGPPDDFDGISNCHNNHTCIVASGTALRNGALQAL